MSEERRGLLLGVVAYALWGLFPLYFPLLAPASPVEILAHRVVWSLLVVGVVLVVRAEWGFVARLRASPRQVAALALAAVAIAANWGTYIYGVTSHQVVETSLGYFINPLVTVLLGVFVLRERLRRAQWWALGVGTVAVLILAVDYGRVPWIALILAFSFGLYGLLKKQAKVVATESLAVETLVLFVPALVVLAVLSARGTASVATEGPGHALLLATTGVVTAVPLLCFGGAARRVPLSTIGLLQYLAPVLQFLIGVVVLHEPMPAARLAGFALVWIALMVFTVDALRNGRRQSALRRSVESVSV